MGNTNGTHTGAPKLKRQWTSNKLKTGAKSNDNDYFTRYNESELTLLDRMFQDLAKRSPNQTMSKETFLEYFGLPGILGERLFSVFDTKNTGVIDFEEFVTGLARYNKGSMMDKIDMLFELYDLDGQAYVTKEELSIILFSLITPTTAMFFSTNNKQNKSEEDKEKDSTNDDAMGHVSLLTRNTVEKLVTEAFEHCDSDNSGKLSKEQFATWVKMNPSVLNSLETAFVKHVWSVADEEPLEADDERKEQFLSHSSMHNLHKASQSSMHTLHRIDSPRFSKFGSGIDASQSELLPRQPLPPHFQPLYNQLQEQYLEDSMKDEHDAYLCHTCKVKFYKSMYVDDKGNPEYSKYVFFKSNPNYDSQTNSLEMNVSTSPIGSNSNLMTFPNTNNNNNNNNNNNRSSGAFSRPKLRKASSNKKKDEKEAKQNSNINLVNNSNTKPIVKALNGSNNNSNNIHNNNNNNNNNIKAIPKTPAITIKYCPQCGGLLTEIKVKMSINLQSAMTLTADLQKEEMQKLVKSGHLQKRGATFHTWIQRFYVIKDKFLYSFKNKDDEAPTNVMFISGWFIIARDDEHNKKGYFGIELQPPHHGDQPKNEINGSNSDNDSGPAPVSTHAQTNSVGNVLTEMTHGDEPQSKMLYARNIKERDEWVAALQEAASTVSIGNYFHIGKVLGKGHFSVVHLGTHKRTNKKYAIKIVEKKRIDAREKMALRNEIAIMKLVNHPCIIKMEDVYEDKKCIYMVMRLVEHGDFFGRWQSKKNFKEDTIRIIIWKLLDALHYLHNLGIVHRDLKPENILCTDANDDTQLLISDFGLSKFAAPHTEMTMSCGTLAYVAPEVLKQKGYSWKVDLWSLGCIMHLLIRNVLPFDGRTKEQVIERTLNKTLDLVTKPIWKEISVEAKDLLSKLLEKDPQQRIDLQSAVNHKWFDPIRNNTKYMLHHKVSADLVALTTGKSVPNSPLNSPNGSTQVTIDVKPKVPKINNINNVNNGNNGNTKNRSIANSGTTDADDKFVMVDDSMNNK